MRSFFSSVLVFAVLFALSSCCAVTQSCSCDNAEAEDLQLEGENLAWAHYQSGETFEFENENGDVQILEVVSKSPETLEIDRGDECQPHKYESVYYDIYFNNEPLLNVEIAANGSIVFYVAAEDVGFCDIAGKNCQDYYGEEFSGTFSESLLVNGQTFDEVFSVELPGTLMQLDWSRNEGVVQFENGGTVWTLME